MPLVNAAITRRALIVSTASAAAVAATPALFAKTTTAPAAWYLLATDPYKGKQDDIAFISPDAGWYGNGAGKLYGTTNGGATWQQVADMPGTFIRALGFIDAQRGFLGNVGTDYYPGVTDTHPLYRTVDGGKTWIAVTAPGIEKVKGICGIHILEEKRIFQGELRSNHIIHAAGRVGGPGYVLRSADSGATWTVLDVSAQAGMILDVKFLSAQTGFLCTATPSVSGEGEAQILRTTDGGSSWTSVYRSGRKLENCWKMSFPSAKTGYATVQSYDTDPGMSRRVIIKTTDGGKNWKEIFLVDDVTVREFGIGFIDDRRGWVGTSGSGFETRDGGKSWIPAGLGRATNKIRVIKTSGGHRVFAIGVTLQRLDLPPAA
jgi:photosystem II stability/assembly factor-like uncharacterized protein